MTEPVGRLFLVPNSLDFGIDGAPEAVPLDEVFRFHDE